MEKKAVALELVEGAGHLAFGFHLGNHRDLRQGWQGLWQDLWQVFSKEDLCLGYLVL